MKKVTKKIVKRAKKSKLVIDKNIVMVCCQAGHIEDVFIFPTLAKARAAAKEIVENSEMRAVVGEGYRK